MQYVDRSRVLPPPSLVTDNIVKENLYDIGAFLALESQRRAQTRPPRLASLSKVEGLKDSLYELFNGRCAFCECNHHSLSIQRFRPSSNATPMGKMQMHRFITFGLLGHGKTFISSALSVMS